MSAEAQVEVERLLALAGYVASGGVQTPSGAVRIAGNRFVATRTSRRSRWAASDNRRATVGPRTTCLYRVEAHEARDFQNFATRDLADILAALEARP